MAWNPAPLSVGLGTGRPVKH